MNDARITSCICWHALNSYSNTDARGKVDLVAERVISVSDGNVNLKLVISLVDKTPGVSGTRPK
jgi:hypothetical protein